MRTAVWVMVAVLALVHFDFWLWDDTTLVFGFMPIGLAYHAGFSIACGMVWLLAVKFAWPAELEAWASEGEGAGSVEGGTEMSFHEAAGHASDPFATEEDSL